jgi:hypothetical protein
VLVRVAAGMRCMQARLEGMRLETTHVDVETQGIRLHEVRSLLHRTRVDRVTRCLPSVSATSTGTGPFHPAVPTVRRRGAPGAILAHTSAHDRTQIE